MRRAGRVALLAAAATALALASCAAPGRERAAAPVAARFALPDVAGAGPPARVVLITIHGLGAGALQGERPLAPTLAALADRGVLAERVVPVFPPTAYPAHTSLVTGRPPALHGVPADHLLGERGVRPEPYAHASRVRARTLWQAASAAGRAVAALDWPATQGAALAALLPDARAPRAGETWTAQIAEGTTPWVLDLLREAGGESAAAATPGPARDAVLAGVACALLASPTPPDLLLLRLRETQPAIETYGPGTREVERAIAGADAQVARVLGCLARAARLQETAVVVTGDHGTLPVHTALRPNAVLADAGLVTAEPSGRVIGWRALARSNGGSAFVYARSEEDAVLARRALSEAAADSRSFRVLSASEMIRVGGDPEAWFGLAAEPGWRFEDGAGSPFAVASLVRGVGGYLPDVSAMETVLVAWGPGVRTRVRAPVLRQLDVAPTVVRLLGVDLGRVEGRAVPGLLRTPGRREGGGGRGLGR